MFRLIHGHWLKTKRTPLRWLSWLLPILYGSALFLYFFTQSGPRFNVYQEFQAFFLLFAMAALFSLSFYVPLLCSLDKVTGFFGNELRIGVSRKKLFVSRYLFLLGLTGWIEAVAFLVFSGLQFLLSGRVLSLSVNFFFLFGIFVSLMPIILLYLFLALLFNEAGSLVAGILFTLSGILLGTTDLGASIWFFIPWTWGFRLIYKVMPQQVIQETFQEYWAVIWGCLLLSLLLLLLELFWYNRWEGISTLEE